MSRVRKDEESPFQQRKRADSERRAREEGKADGKDVEAGGSSQVGEGSVAGCGVAADSCGVLSWPHLLQVQSF